MHYMHLQERGISMTKMNKEKIITIGVISLIILAGIALAKKEKVKITEVTFKAI